MTRNIQKINKRQINFVGKLRSTFLFERNSHSDDNVCVTEYRSLFSRIFDYRIYYVINSRRYLFAFIYIKQAVCLFSYESRLDTNYKIA